MDELFSGLPPFLQLIVGTVVAIVTAYFTIKKFMANGTLLNTKSNDNTVQILVDAIKSLKNVVNEQGKQIDHAVKEISEIKNKIIKNELE